MAKWKLEPSAGSVGYWAENRPAAGTAHSLPTRLFPTDNWWNLDISGVAVDAQSASILSGYNGNSLLTDFGNNYGLPYCTVSGNHPTISFAGGSYWAQSDDVPYPIPLQCYTEAGWMEELDKILPDPITGGVDRHLLIVDVDNERLYEIYQPFYNNTGSPVEWNPAGNPGVYVDPGDYWCASACYWDMTTNDTRPEGWTSSDAAGLQVLPGLVSYDEVTGSSPITHAHRFTVAQAANYYVWPATHGTSTAGTMPLGARLRLKASFNISPYGANAQRLLQAFKTYGLIMADNGGTGMVTGTNDSRWGAYDSDIRVELVTALSAVDMGTDCDIVTLGYGEP